MPCCACSRSRRPPRRPRCACSTPRCGCAAGSRTGRTSASSAASATRAPRPSWRRRRISSTISSARPCAGCHSSEGAGMNPRITLGAVAYDPKVVTIWEGFQRFFAGHGLDFDCVLFTNYERQVEQHFAGAFDVAWNSPLAWIETARVAKRRGRQARAIAMRDTDRDLTSVIVARADSSVRSLADLRGKRVGVGAGDSPQATLIPLLHLAEAGLERGRDIEVVEFDVLPGKHGDHVGGERDAAKALLAGKVDAACMIDGNLLAFSADGTLRRDTTRVVAQTGKYDH